MTYLPDEKLTFGAFGEQTVSELTPITQIMGFYGLGSKTEVFTANGGSATTNTQSEFVCQTGTTVGGYGVIRAKRPVVYKPGQGVTCLFTARFTTGVASSLQIAGCYSATDGFVFGYDGTN
jgi:hypothetical protein